MTIKRQRRTKNLTVIPNDVFAAKLSLQALGLLTYLLSKPDDWQVIVEELKATFNVGKHAIYTALDEIIKAGYAAKKLGGGGRGGVDYWVYDEPHPLAENRKAEGPLPEIPLAEIPLAENQPLLSTEVQLNTEKPPNTDRGGASEKPTGEKPKRQTSKSITFAEFRQQCKDANEPAIPKDDAVFSYADSIKMPHDFVRLAWREFAASHQERTDKKQVGVRGWRQAFGNYVRRNYLGLWRRDERGDWSLTTAGFQAQAAYQAERAGSPQPTQQHGARA